MTDRSDRYIRQRMFAPFGDSGQERLKQARVLVCGCGALGSVIANTLARAGVGHLRIVDRDFLELNNLQRQVLYTEEDVKSRMPKAIAAANQLRKINSEIEIEPVVADVNFENIQSLLDGVQVIADGTDNFETRFLLNDASHQFKIPWVYGGCIGSEGQSMTIIPGSTPCLRCIMPEIPPPGTTPTCDTAGILGPVVNVIASIQSNEVLKIAAGLQQHASDKLSVIDLWNNRIRQIGLSALRSDDCETCGRGQFDWLAGTKTSHTAVLCGRNAVQLAFPDRHPVDLESLEVKLASLGEVHRNPFLLKASIEPYEITVFTDGRAVIGGTDDPATAKSVYARYLGN